MQKFVTLILLTVVCLFTTNSYCDDDKMTAEQLVARHLDAIGAKEVRSKVTGIGGRASVGWDMMTGGAPHADGKATLVSRGGQFKYNSVFTAPRYQGERIVWDGEKADILNNGSKSKSHLGWFLYQHDTLLREGLFGGIYNSAWPLAKLNAEKVSLHYDGMKKFNGRPAHQLSYHVRKGEAELSVQLYFDPESYQHVGSIYEFAGQAQHGIDVSKAVERLTETFTDFRQVNGITVPHTWQINVDDDTKNLAAKWRIGFPEVLVEAK